MPTTTVLYRNRLPVPDNAAIHVDHYEDTFTLTASSLSGLTINDIKNLLQSKFKVDQINHDQHIVISR